MIGELLNYYNHICMNIGIIIITIMILAMLFDIKCVKQLMASYFRANGYEDASKMMTC
jgi:hypothetical protein